MQECSDQSGLCELERCLHEILCALCRLHLGMRMRTGDGASFAGNVEAPFPINGTVIYYRGHRVLDALIGNMLATKSLRQATDLIVTVRDKCLL